MLSVSVVHVFADKGGEGSSVAAASDSDGDEDGAEATEQAGSAGREAADKTPVGMFQSPTNTACILAIIWQYCCILFGDQHKERHAVVAVANTMQVHVSLPEKCKC